MISEIDAVHTITGDFIKTAPFEIDLQAFNNILVTIKALRVDNIVYTIPYENRLYTVPAENRLYTIRSETRSYTVPQETRSHTVSDEDRLYDIEGHD